jgi:hypothetical protein
LANKREAIRLRTAMMQVEAVVKILQPDFNVCGIAAKRCNKSHPWFKRGTLFRSAVDVLRRAGAPMTAREIADALVADKAPQATRKQAIDLQAAILAAPAKARRGDGDRGGCAGALAIGRQLGRAHFLLRSPTGDDYVLSSARGKFGIAHVSVANHCPRLDSLDAGCVQHGSRPWQIDQGVARHEHDLWAVGASRPPHSRQATRQQNRPRLKLGHCYFQIRPLRVEAGQYPLLAGKTPTATRKQEEARHSSRTAGPER